MEGNIILCSYHLESHRGRPLVEHLKCVSELAVLIIKDLQRYSPCIADPRFTEALKIIGLSHDIGKSTIFFQEYLYDKKHDQFLKSHSTLSSLYGILACRNILKDDFLSFINFILIKVNH